MRNWFPMLFGVLVLCLVSRPASAQLLVQDSSRSVVLNGYAGAGSVNSTYAVTNMSLAPSSYSYALTTNASAYSVGTGAYGLDVSAYSRTQASQNSLVSAAGFDFNSSLLTETWSDLPTWGGATSAFAQSHFQVSFYVPLTLDADLACRAEFLSHDYPALNFRVTLSAADGQTPIVDWTREALPLITGDPYRVTLNPGKLYTLNLEMDARASIPDPLGELGGVYANMSFTPVLTPVPEPSSVALLVLGTVVLMGRKRRNRD